MKYLRQPFMNISLRFELRKIMKWMLHKTHFEISFCSGITEQSEKHSLYRNAGIHFAKVSKHSIIHSININTYYIIHAVHRFHFISRERFTLRT